MPIFLPRGIKCGSCSGASHRWENEEWKVLREDIQVFSIRMEMWWLQSSNVFWPSRQEKYREDTMKEREAIKREKWEEKVFSLRCAFGLMSTLQRKRTHNSTLLLWCRSKMQDGWWVSAIETSLLLAIVCMCFVLVEDLPLHVILLVRGCLKRYV